MRFRAKSFNANFIVGSACNGIPFSRRFRYMRAIIGFSELFDVSSSIMLASVHTCSGVSPSTLAFSLRLKTQNLSCSFFMRPMRLSIDVFQYTSYVFGTNIQTIVAVSNPCAAQNEESLNSIDSARLSIISFLPIAPARRSVVRLSGIVSLMGS